MAYKGKNTCRILKDIRRQIAEANDIDLVIKECTYQGDCKGTCPRCEAEVAYLERELARRQAMGKAVRIVGLAAASFAAAACSLKPQQKPIECPEDDILEGEEIYDPSIVTGELTTSDTTPLQQKRNACRPQADADVEVVDEMGDIELDPYPMMGEDESTADGIMDEEVEGEVFVVCEKMPEYPGGTDALLKFLSENVHYPAEAAEEKKEGRAVVQFIVRKDGSISDIAVVRSAGDERLDKEAVRVVESMPAWTPGEMRGKLVDVKFTVPIKFSLQ